MWRLMAVTNSFLQETNFLGLCYCASLLIGISFENIEGVVLLHQNYL